MRVELLVGILSQIFFAICLLPQVVKLFTAKTTKGVSWLMWFFQGLGFLFGLWYGISLSKGPLIWGNIWGLICSAAFIIGYLKYRGR
jgi:uncharacterized protein with PQ loop repeat